MAKRTDCSRNVEKMYLKDLKQCLQNLFLKREKKEMLFCMYVKYSMDEILHDDILLFGLFLVCVNLFSIF